MESERKAEPGYGNRYSQDAATQPRGEPLLPGDAGHLPPAEPGCEQRGCQQKERVVEDHEEKGIQHGDFLHSQRMFAPGLKGVVYDTSVAHARPHDELQGRRRQGLGVREHISQPCGKPLPPGHARHSPAAGQADDDGRDEGEQQPQPLREDEQGKVGSHPIDCFRDTEFVGRAAGANGITCASRWPTGPECQCSFSVHRGVNWSQLPGRRGMA